jgi:hypothetical protein
MSKNPKTDQPDDDWPGLAQDLFGLTLDNANNDDDLLGEDLFKIELPGPVAAEVVTETASSVPTSVGLPVEASTEPILATPSAPATSSIAAKPVAKKPVPASDDEPFGAGLIDEDEIENQEPASASEVVSETVVEIRVGDPSAASKEAVTDSDPEGLTLPEDFDDGLTLPPEGVAADQLENEETDDTEVVLTDRDADRSGVRADRPRRRRRHRTREDAYWDMLENWEWEEIPPSDSDSAESDRPRGGRDRSRRTDRGHRGRRPDPEVRSDDRVSSSGDADLRRELAAAPGERPSQRDRGGRREHGARDHGRRSERNDRANPDQPRHESRTPSNPQRQPSPSKPTMATAPLADDFGAGIFDESPAPLGGVPQSTESGPTLPNEEIAQSSQAGDKLLFDSDRAASLIDDDLVWEDSDSDVAPVEPGRLLEPAALPAADHAGESDQVFESSDVTPLEDSDDLPRLRRRRRRRHGRRDPRDPTEAQSGSTFDLSEALSSCAGDTPDFIPSASAEDLSVDEASTAEGAVDASMEERPSDRRGGRRRRRRRVRGDAPPELVDAAGSAIEPDGMVETRTSVEELAIKPTVYRNIPTWEETIRFLLQPHLVGRNLGPDDAADNLEGDPRGSGGAEPTPPPPRRRGGRGRGRRS